MWIYTNTLGNKNRFTLGELNSDNYKNTLYCFGINPSTATPKKLDPTLAAVKKISILNGFDSWIMLNIYPQRATNPNNLHLEFDRELHSQNLDAINTIIKHDSTVWAAWGTLIEKRKYLKKCLQDIHLMLLYRNIKWVTRGNISKKGHPHHPLYVKDIAEFETFDMNKYIKEIL